MDIDELNRIIYEKEFKKATDNCFILNPREYATDVTNLILECEGRNNCHNHNESFQGVDISKYLLSIKNSEIEYALILAISNEVKDTFLICGEKDRIHAVSYFEKKANSISAIEFISKWYTKGVKICNYHNHPLRIAAIPSDSDILSFCETSKTEYQKASEWDECVKKYKIDYPAGFCYGDWGVVTSYDFFSYSQHIEEGCDIQDLYNYNIECKMKRDMVLCKYDLDD